MGNTSPPSRRRGCWAKAPHIRGEYSEKHLRFEIATGSSPHPWGILAGLHQLAGDLRFIPTSVGNTRTSGTPGTSMAVHPHIRGEYLLISASFSAIGGSSPHPWGIRGSSELPRRLHRFIPTSVGNTGSYRRIRRLPSVHPHIRGEYICAGMSEVAVHGSSPHPWGILFESHECPSRSRFIPTSVGNTHTLACPDVLQAVHPHIRGEYFQIKIFPIHKSGSSPHPWGILLALGNESGYVRFIPTSVGNTEDV